MAGKVWKISICMMLTVLLCACTGNDMMEKKVRDLDFTVVSAEDISEELKSHIDERKEETFTLIYREYVSDCRIWQSGRRRLQH